VTEMPLFIYIWVALVVSGFLLMFAGMCLSSDFEDMGGTAVVVGASLMILGLIVWTLGPELKVVIL